jgi:leucyl-tRNA synthetase
MELVNRMNQIKTELPLNDPTWRQALERLVALLAPFAPHISEELWQALGHDGSVHFGTWPQWDDDLVKEELLTIVVQVNGKVRANLQVAAGTPMDEVIAQARREPNVKKHLSSEPVQTVTIPDKLINFVV